MYTYILGQYYSNKRNRMVEVFWGPFADDLRADTEALKALCPLPSSTYELKHSRYGTRAMARQEVMAANISGGGSIESALTRYSRNPEAMESGA